MNSACFTEKENSLCLPLCYAIQTNLNYSFAAEISFNVYECKTRARTVLSLSISLLQMQEDSSKRWIGDFLLTKWLENSYPYIGYSMKLGHPRTLDMNATR